jgi:hypothetical protein
VGKFGYLKSLILVVNGGVFDRNGRDTVDFVLREAELAGFEVLLAELRLFQFLKLSFENSSNLQFHVARVVVEAGVSHVDGQVVDSKVRKILLTVLVVQVLVFFAVDRLDLGHGLVLIGHRLLLRLKLLQVLPHFYHRFLRGYAHVACLTSKASRASLSFIGTPALNRRSTHLIESFFMA